MLRDPTMDAVLASGLRVSSGVGSARGIVEVVRSLGGGRILLVSDPGVEAAGHVGAVASLLEVAGLGVTRFVDVDENPTTDHVNACVEAARRVGVDLWVAVGGGSAIDVAKAANVLVTQGGQVADYRGVGTLSGPTLPLVAIPTTAGTGTECQSAALIADAQTHEKIACLAPGFLPQVAILDPLLTVTQPDVVTAATGLDALTHGAEAVVTRGRTAQSTERATRAFVMAATHLRLVLERPGNVAARSVMQRAAALAGMAIEESMLGAAHAAGNPLTARFHVTHGFAVAAMLPEVMRFNAQDPEVRGSYAKLATLTGVSAVGASDAEATDRLVAHVEGLVAHSGAHRGLPHGPAAREAIAELAQDASAQWTGGFNPRPVTAADFEGLYQRTFSRAWAEGTS